MPDTLLFERLGLSLNEQRCYLHLLNSGEQTAAQISKATGISRTNVYHLTQKLSTTGLISAIDRGPKTYFIALHPRNLESLLDREEAKIKETKQLLKLELPDLIMNHSLGGNSSGVYRFEGIAGLERVYSELIRDRVAVNSIVNRSLLREYIAEFNPKYIKDRIRYRIHSRVICPDRKKINSSDSAELRQVRYIEPAKLPFSMDLKVTSKKVVITTLTAGEIVGIILNDKPVVQNFGFLFEFLWGVANPA